MAEPKTKTQAQKAAGSQKKPKAPANKPAPQDQKKKGESQSKPEEKKWQIPVRMITSIVCAVLFVIFLVMSMSSEGVLVDLIKRFVLGLMGYAAFYISIPALLYLFVIQAFSGKRPIVMRSVCVICFVLLCGCISQLPLATANMPEGLAVVGWLYEGGMAGTTAGLICGGITLLLKLVLGSILPWIALIVAALLTLLAAFQITIPSIIRAVQNRPRGEWEDEEEQPPEPAAVVVNRIANRRIEQEQERRRKAAEQPEIDVPVDDEPVPPPATRRRPSKKASEFMEQIDSDVESPVAAAGRRVSADTPLVPPSDPVTTPPIPNVSHFEMPPEQMIPFQKEMPQCDSVDAPVEEPVPVVEPPVETPPRKVTAQEAEESAAQVAAEIAEAESAEKAVYCFPPIDLLHIPQQGGQDGTGEMRENSRRLSETLESFKIDAHIINVTRGPSVTRYEVELDKGVRLNKLTTCADDIALSLGASGVRIAAIPGKISVVGIEVPNRAVTTVSLREVIDSNEFIRAKSKSSFAVGKDIGGSCIVGNIAKLPHMLIAGTTGSGKSVCMNSIIISLLYKASPDDVKLIMVDPKMVELGIYNGIPHLLIPVVTDPKKAAGSLQWAVTEMMRRYKVMSEAGVRDLEAYNSIIESQEIDGTKLPQVVVIIDELADLMLVAAKEVEESICRIAQMGRAAGIHLIIATQRPSADVITGLMKANIPSRIAFAVASAMESRIILDTQGAEKLVGRGDMLFAPIGAGKPLRVQGCFVSDDEVEAVATYVKENYLTAYDEQVLEDIERKAAQTGNSKAPASDPEPTASELDGDEMLPAAVDVILETGQASVSMLQRRLKLGYARAARIVDEMEEKGIVGPFQGSKPRTILITKEQWEAMKSGQPTQMEFADLEEDSGVPEELY